MRRRVRVGEGSYVLLYHDSGRKWLVRATREGRLHTHLGFLDHSQLISKRYGSSVGTSLQARLWILQPTMNDFAMKAERRTQVVYPKDFGMIVGETGLSHGYRVVEAGTGSGVLTMFMANIVGPKGRVVSMESREEFQKLAQKNIEKAGLQDFVELVKGDARHGFPASRADLAVIDVGDPWNLVGPAKQALKGSGQIVVITPTVNQMERVVLTLRGAGFVNVRSLEVMNREFEVKAGATRPRTRVVAHTAYLTFGRRTLRGKH